MRDERNLMRQIMGEDYTWKGKSLVYDLDWCALCDTATIVSPCGCHGSACNAGGCEKCVDDHHAFNKLKTTVGDYLSGAELEGYKKGLKLQKWILESLTLGEKEIDWKRMVTTGHTSGNDQQTFKEFINEDWKYEPNNSQSGT